MLCLIIGRVLFQLKKCLPWFTCFYSCTTKNMKNSSCKEWRPWFHARDLKHQIRLFATACMQHLIRLFAVACIPYLIQLFSMACILHLIRLFFMACILHQIRLFSIACLPHLIRLFSMAFIPHRSGCLPEDLYAESDPAVFYGHWVLIG